MNRLLETARNAALAGGRVVRERASNVGAVRSKGSATDFVSDSDIASGVAVVEAIRSAMPGARVVCEEPEVYEIVGITPGDLSDSGELWVIDPIDGTTSFLHGYPCYSVSVACLQDGQPVAGAVYNAALDEMNSAAVGLGAWRDDVALRVTNAATVPESLLVTGFPYDRTAPLDRQLATLGAFLRAPVHGIRRDGSAALDCCHVAGARCDGFWEFHLKVWDMAAGVVILREAGATVTDTDGGTWTTATDSLCTANPALHAAMLDVIRGAAAG